MKTASKIVCSVYVATLAWLLLFKLAYPQPVLLHYHTRGLSLIPFAGFSEYSLRDAFYNCLVFVPFGLLLSVQFKQASFWQKVLWIAMFSLTVEILQYIFAIGITDITDVLMNSLGGLVGLGVYEGLKKYVDEKQLDQFIVIAGALILIILLGLRIFVFRVRYQ